MELGKYCNNLNKILLFLILSNFLLVGCATERLVTRTVYVPHDIPIISRPKSLTLHEPYFYVVTEENIEEFLERFEKENGAIVFYALSVPDYEDIALNLAELKRYIDQQKSLIVYYEDSIQKNQVENKVNTKSEE